MTQKTDEQSILTEDKIRMANNVKTKCLISRLIREVQIKALGFFFFYATVHHTAWIMSGLRLDLVKN